MALYSTDALPCGRRLGMFIPAMRRSLALPNKGNNAEMQAFSGVR